ncbi:hypothetical protein [Bradyrhizobium sp. STM 3557]
MMTPLAIPGLAIFIGVIGAVLAGMLSKQPVPKPVRARPRDSKARRG